MSFKTFKDFLAIKEVAVTNPLNPQMPANNSPAAKTNIQNTLRSAMNTPPPTGVNPQMYKNKLMQAMQVSRTGNVATPKQAIDLVNVQQQAAQP